MEINEDSLKKLIEYIIKKVRIELDSNREEIFAILTDGWRIQYPAFFENINNIEGIQQVNVVVPPSINNECIQILKSFKSCGTIFSQNEINPKDINQFITVFPTTPRELIVKTALGIDDTFETKWIRNCFEKGQKIILLSSGLERFTGKEPQKYVQTIQSYYKTALEYGIEINDKFNPYDIRQLV